MCLILGSVFNDYVVFYLYVYEMPVGLAHRLASAALWTAQQSFVYPNVVRSVGDAVA